jgi:uncharacterized protein (DUF433 family)
MDFAQYITRDPLICGGQPVIMGTRVLVRTILASLADGDTADEIIRDFPTVPRQAVEAIIAFAAASAAEDMPVPGAPTL